MTTTTYTQKDLSKMARTLVTYKNKRQDRKVRFIGYTLNVHNLGASLWAHAKDDDGAIHNWVIAI